MAWEIVVDGVPQPGSYKDYVQFAAALTAAVKEGRWPAEAAIQVRRKLTDDTPHSDTIDVGGKKVRIYTYERKLHHNTVMTGAILIGMALGFWLRGTL
jgi:hypothetical protein